MLKPDDLINKVKSYNRFLNPETLSKAYDFLKKHIKNRIKPNLVYFFNHNTNGTNKRKTE